MSIGVTVIIPTDAKIRVVSGGRLDDTRMVEFRQHLIKLRLDSECKEAQAANAAVNKPPAAVKSQKGRRAPRNTVTEKQALVRTY